VRKALVQIYAGQSRMTFSDGDGRFQLEGIPAGNYSVTAQKPGYFNAQEMARSGATIIEVGPKSAAVEVKLTPEAVITGKVTSTVGRPLERVTLHLRSVEVREGRRRWEFKGTATTDVDGRFRIANLRPGSYYLFLSPHASQPQLLIDATLKPTMGYRGMYYSGAPDLASASVIELKAGEQLEANFALDEVPVYAASGTVSGYDANQGVGIQVYDLSGSQVECNVQFSALNGRFDITGLTAGDYVIKAYSTAQPNQQVRADQRFHLTGDVHSMHLALAAAPSIPVVVQMEQAGPKQKGGAALNRLGSSGPPVSVRLLSAGPTGAESFAGFENAQNPQTLQFRGVEPGRYTAIIDAREAWYVASAEYGQTNLLTDDLVVQPGTSASSINLVLRNDSGSLSGTANVPDGFASQVTIVAIPLRAANASPAVTYLYPAHDKAAKPSEFLLDSLAPGDYQVYAFDDSAGIEYTNREALDAYASQATQVTVAPNQRAKATLPLIRTGESSQ
jgi:hypothetical protein